MQRLIIFPPLGYSADYLLVFLEDLLKLGGSILGYGQPFLQALNSKCTKMWYFLSAPATSRWVSSRVSYRQRAARWEWWEAVGSGGRQQVVVAGTGGGLSSGPEWAAKNLKRQHS